MVGSFYGKKENHAGIDSEMKRYMINEIYT